MPKLLFTKIKWSENSEVASENTQIISSDANSTKIWLIKNNDQKCSYGVIEIDII